MSVIGGEHLDWGEEKKSTFFPRLLFLLYIGIMVYFLFYSPYFKRDMATRYYNLTLFKEIKRFIYNASYFEMKYVFINVAGNVLAFMPLGYLLPLITNKKINLFKAFLVSFGTTLLVETLQYLTMRGSFDVDDLFLNTIGGVLGYITYCIIAAIRKKRAGRREA